MDSGCLFVDAKCSKSTRNLVWQSCSGTEPGAVHGGCRVALNCKKIHSEGKTLPLTARTAAFRFHPDHNLVELQVDNFGNWDASAEWMRTSEAFRQNPRGAFFDPDHVLAAYKAGATFEQLQRDTYAGEYPPSKPPNLHAPAVR